jgi:PPOX class probable FMN-dependent enzyme
MAQVDLTELYPPPSGIARTKQIDHLDQHCRDFIALSPFVTLATSGADGSCDVSPRGGPAGFVKVLDERRVAIPDAKGNRRIDSLGNIAENAQAALLFLIPGMGETLRVNGSASLETDPDLLEAVAVDGTGVVPQLAVVVEADEVFLHCGKALIRSKLWDTDTWPEEKPSAARIFKDHAKLPERVEDIQAYLEEGQRKRLY